MISIWAAEASSLQVWESTAPDICEKAKTIKLCAAVCSSVHRHTQRQLKQAMIGGSLFGGGI